MELNQIFTSSAMKITCLIGLKNLVEIFSVLPIWKVLFHVSSLIKLVKISYLK